MELDEEDTGDDGIQLVPGSNGMNVPSTCTIVIIAGITHPDDEDKEVGLQLVPETYGMDQCWAELFELFDYSNS